MNENGERVSLRAMKHGPAGARWLFVALFALLTTFVAGPQAWAVTGPWASATLGPGVTVEARLIAAVEAVGDLDEVPAGLEVSLPDGWKSYWRSPGDAGLPPALD